MLLLAVSCRDAAKEKTAEEADAELDPAAAAGYSQRPATAQADAQEDRAPANAPDADDPPEEETPSADAEGPTDGAPATPAEPGGEATAAGEAEPAGDEGSASGAPTQEPDAAALLAEVERRATTDERAMQALTEAEKAGATKRQLAQAAYERGQALHATPDRATKFFAWAADKDPKYAEPVFALAKQQATKGEVDATIKHLVEVKARGGTKLLQQIEFDPMWEIVKDDPEVRALL